MEVDGWKVELMEELVDGSDVFFVVGRAVGSGSQSCQGLKSAAEFEPHE